MQIASQRLAALAKPVFPRASNYDLEWQFQTMMGPNVLWLAEWASQAVPLRKGMRVLDLGCGKAASAIFLAKEFDVTVCAADFWIAAGDNWKRIELTSVADKVFPIRAEAHSLPFAENYFDVIFSFDAYHYFGTNDLYVGYITKFLRLGGHLCIVSPGLNDELPNGPPDAIRPYWEWEFCAFHSPLWWRRHLEKSGIVEIELADALTDGWRYWAEWNECCAAAKIGLQDGTTAAREAEMLRLDGGQNLTFTRILAKKIR